MSDRVNLEYLRKQAKTILKQIINRCGVSPAGVGTSRVAALIGT